MGVNTPISKGQGGVILKFYNPSMDDDGYDEVESAL